MGETTEAFSVADHGPSRRRPGMHYIGMDVHSKVTMICVLDEMGKTVREMKVRGDLREVVGVAARIREELGQVKVCYEASCGYGWLYDRLTGLGCRVQVAHPGKTRLIFRTKRKNDRIDAEKLAKLVYLDEVPLAYVPAAECRDWRSLIEYRQQLIASRVAAKNRLRALLRRNGGHGPRALWTRRGLEHLSAEALPECEAVQRELLLEVLRSTTEHIRKVGQILGRMGRLQPAVGLLMTIPGVGIRTAEAVVAYVDDAERFRRNKSVGCYFGLVPCEDTSVKTRLGHITKEGPATVRKLLVEAAWQGIRRDATLRSYYERMRREDPKRGKIAVVATAHHLLRVMHAMLKTGEVWRSEAA